MLDTRYIIYSPKYRLHGRHLSPEHLLSLSVRKQRRLRRTENLHSQVTSSPSSSWSWSRSSCRSSSTTRCAPSAGRHTGPVSGITCCACAASNQIILLDDAFVMWLNITFYKIYIYFWSLFKLNLLVQERNLRTKCANSSAAPLVTYRSCQLEQGWQCTSCRGGCCGPPWRCSRSSSPPRPPSTSWWTPSTGGPGWRDITISKLTRWA